MSDYTSDLYWKYLRQYQAGEISVVEYWDKLIKIEEDRLQLRRLRTLGLTATKA